MRNASWGNLVRLKGMSIRPYFMKITNGITRDIAWLFGCAVFLFLLVAINYLVFYF